MFKFTIRELLLLTVIVGLALGWWLRERHFHAELQRRWQTLARYHTSAIRWRTMALAFAQGMRTDGWHVAVEHDASSWTMNPRQNLKREQARQMNESNPLPTVFDLPTAASFQ